MTTDVDTALYFENFISKGLIADGGTNDICVYDTFVGLRADAECICHDVVNQAWISLPKGRNR